jgi:transposase
MKRLLFIMHFIFLITFCRISKTVYVDESGVHRHYQRDRARAKRGVRVHAEKPGKRTRKTNVIAGLCGKKHIAVRSYEHSTNAAFFEEWFEWELLGVVPKRSVIIMDNASFHRKKQLHEIAAKYGVFILFLPPYSPDFNKIEVSWANLKRWLKDNLMRFPSLEFAINWYFSD